MMIKFFRAYDGEQYWYSDENWLFLNGYKAVSLQEATFTMKDVDVFIGKVDANNAKIYENDIIINPHIDKTKLFHVVWSPDKCGFRKVPYGLSSPETRIDEAFMEIIGTIHSIKE